MEGKRSLSLAALLLAASLRFAATTDQGNWSNPFCYRNVFNRSDPIAEVERVTLEEATIEFVASRMHLGQPYVVSGVTTGWPANDKWCHDYFRRLFGGHQLFSSTFSTPMSPDFSARTPPQETYYGIFLNSRSSAGLVAGDYSYPSFIPPEWRVTGNEWLHWGFPPCGAKRHMDITCTSRLSVQVTGEKLWRLYPVTMATSTRYRNWTNEYTISWAQQDYRWPHAYLHAPPPLIEGSSDWVTGQLIFKMEVELCTAMGCNVLLRVFVLCAIVCYYVLFKHVLCF